MATTLAALSFALAPATRAAVLDEDILSSLVVQEVSRPSPVLGADDRVHLAYEMLLVNQSTFVVTIDGVAVHDGDMGRILEELTGKGLDALLSITGSPSAAGATLGPGRSALLTLDVSVPNGTAVPNELVHRITVTRTMAGRDGDETSTTPLKPDAGIPATVTFTTGIRASDAPAVVLEPPLRGDGWLVVNGCCDAVNAHRGAVRAFDGTIYVAERFALDFVRLDRDGRLFAGPVDELTSYGYFGVPVYAVADGAVAVVRDGDPEEVPGRLPAGRSMTDTGGNHVILYIGGGRYAFFAHLKSGSIRVRERDRVRAGDVLGYLGNSGGTLRPHLQFHVTDSVSPVVANGLPFVFTAFTGEGVLPVDDMDAVLFEGEAATIDRATLAGPHKNQLPLNNQIVEFP
jgi:hypothetical protein